MPSANSVWGAFLASCGFTKELVADSCEMEYTVVRFAADHPEGTYVLALSGHVVTVIDRVHYARPVKSISADGATDTKRDEGRCVPIVELRSAAVYDDQVEALRKQIALFERQKEIVEGSINFSGCDAIFCPSCGAEMEYEGTDETISELKCPECEENFWLKTKVERTYSTAIYKEALMQDDE